MAAPVLLPGRQRAPAPAAWWQRARRRPPRHSRAAAAARDPPAAAKDAWVRNFCMEAELRGGPASGDDATTRLTIRPLPLELLPAAADLLAEVFILSASRSGSAATPPSSQESSPSGSRSASPSPRPPPVPPPPPSLAPYSRFVRRRIAKYLDDHIRPEARTVVLAATVPGGVGDEEDEGARGTSAAAAAADDPAALERQRQEDEVMDAILSARGLGGGGGVSAAVSFDSVASSSSDDAGNDGSDSDGAAAPQPPTPTPPSASTPPARRTLVGTAELSLDSSTRSRYLTLNPPEDAAYLMNTAVDARWRRRGVARALVAAADRVAAHLGRGSVFLHARLIDPPAVALYRSLGFEVVATDGWWLSLIGQDRRHLMMREVVRKEEEADVV
jgi:hypothetical protein